jgi:CO/xanthine dehydrogenase FAD-binding subunit
MTDVINSNGIELRGKQKLIIGADVTLDAVCKHGHVPAIVRDSLVNFSTWQQRNEYTVGKVLLSVSIAPVWATILLSMDASVLVADQTEIAFADFMQLRGSNRGKPAALMLPVGNANQQVYLETIGLTPKDTPVVAAAASMEIKNNKVNSGRIALMGVWKETVKLAENAEILIGKTLDEQVIEETARAIMKEVKPKEDYRGSAEYRRAMAEVLTRRALENCMKGANDHG